MHPFPHHYKVKVAGQPESNLKLTAENLPTLEIAPPPQFDGPGDHWSPEELLMASVANCFVLSFRAIAKAYKLEWTGIECESEGTLDKVDKKVRFTHVLTKAKLCIPASVDVEAAQKALLKAEETCLVSNSLICEVHLEFEIIKVE
jgi:peroxiredoxin-like protein